MAPRSRSRVQDAPEHGPPGQRYPRGTSSIDLKTGRAWSFRRRPALGMPAPVPALPGRGQALIEPRARLRANAILHPSPGRKSSRRATRSGYRRTATSPVTWQLGSDVHGAAKAMVCFCPVRRPRAVLPARQGAAWRSEPSDEAAHESRSGKLTRRGYTSSGGLSVGQIPPLRAHHVMTSFDA